MGTSPDTATRDTAIMTRTLLLVFCLLLPQAFSYIATIDCSDRRGFQETTTSWECDYDGTARCSEVTTSCGSCEDEGSESGGTATYPTEGYPTAVGGGWDCKDKCTKGFSSSGEKTKSKFNYCGK